MHAEASTGKIQPIRIPRHENHGLSNTYIRSYGCMYVCMYALSVEQLETVSQALQFD